MEKRIQSWLDRSESPQSQIDVSDKSGDGFFLPESQPRRCLTEAEMLGPPLRCAGERRRPVAAKWRQPPGPGEGQVSRVYRCTVCTVQGQCTARSHRGARELTGAAHPAPVTTLPSVTSWLSTKTVVLLTAPCSSGCNSVEKSDTDIKTLDNHTCITCLSLVFIPRHV